MSLPLARRVRFTLFLTVIFSGLAALMYEIVWTRLFLLVFGSTTHSLVSVISAFMAGLAVGSIIFGKIADKSVRHLQIFALLELFTAATALLSLPALSFVGELYALVYHQVPSPTLLFFLKFLFTFAILLPPTAAMGGTLPILVKALSGQRQVNPGPLVAKLYALNTLGAVGGTLLAAFIFIEIIGLRMTIVTAALMNLFNALLVFLLPPLKRPILTPDKSPKDFDNHQKPVYPTWKIRMALVAFGISGLTGMAYEVAWTRLLTPTTGTYIYAFAIILSLVLVGITIGSMLAPRIFPQRRMLFLSFGLTQLGIWSGAIASLFFTSQLVHLTKVITIILTILPSTVCLGMTFPIISNLPHLPSQRGKFIGTTYALNTIGSLLGPLLSGFVLLAHLGTTQTIVHLSLVNGILGALMIILEENIAHRLLHTAFAVTTVVAVFAVSILSLSGSNFLIERTLGAYQKKFLTGDYQYQYLEDETAAVLAYRRRDGFDYGLLVDGVGMSVLVDETKLMAHLPLLLHPNPRDVLVIAFGMGTTYRSALSHGVTVDAVELVPSVPKTFPIFFSDATAVLADRAGKIIINDGRNYVLLSQKEYDVITVDPPPPVNSAGTTLLYAQEFYRQSKNRLRSGGLFAQWLFYGTRDDDFKMLVKAFLNEFPFVAVFHSPRAIGIYLIGSNQPISLNKTQIAVRANNPRVKQDLNEWGQWDADNLASLYFGDQTMLGRYAGNARPVTDDHPQTEYFFLRHLFTQAPLARDEQIASFAQ